MKLWHNQTRSRQIVRVASPRGSRTRGFASFQAHLPPSSSVSLPLSCRSRRPVMHLPRRLPRLPKLLFLQRVGRHRMAETLRGSGALLRPKSRTIPSRWTTCFDTPPLAARKEADFLTRGCDDVGSARAPGARCPEKRGSLAQEQPQQPW